MGAEGGTLPPSARSPAHAHACTHTLTPSLFRSVRHSFRQTRDQFVPCRFAYVKPILPFLDQCAEQRHFTPTRWSPVAIRVRRVRWRPSLPPGRRARPLRPASLQGLLRPLPKAPAAGRVWCAGEEGQGAAQGSRS